MIGGFQPAEKRALLHHTLSFRGNAIFNIGETYPKFALNSEIFKTEDDLATAVNESLGNQEPIVITNGLTHIVNTSMGILNYFYLF